MRLALLPLLFIATLTVAQTTTVTYQPDATDFANPERGMYHQAETHPAVYTALDAGTLANWYSTDQHSLILRLFYLEEFVNAPISGTYLMQMQNDMDVLRASGMKAVLRFAYTSNSTAPYGDADKNRVLQHIAQLEPLLRSNADVIAFVQAGFIGTWGEWYYTDHFGLPSSPEQMQDRQEVLEALLDALPEGIMVQLRTPGYKMQFYGNAPLDPNDAFTNTDAARVGHHNDCFLASSTDIGTYADTTVEYPYLHAETEFTPMGGETCAPNAPRSDCPTALEEMALFHWSYLHTDWNPDVIAGFENGGCLPEIKRRLGYRFALEEATLPNTALAGGTLDIDLQLTNSGFTVPYKFRPVQLVLRHVGTNEETILPLDMDVREWDADVTNNLVASADLPNSMPMGEHALFLWLPDSAGSLTSDPRYTIRLANQGTWEASTGYNDLLHTVNVSGSVGVNEPANSERWRVVPERAQEQLRFPGGLAAAGDLLLCDAQGRLVVQAHLPIATTTMPVNALAPGVYTLVLRSSNGAQRTTRFVW